MNEQRICEAIRLTTGVGDNKPYLPRLVTYLAEQYGSYPGVWQEVEDYLFVNRIACIPMLPYPKTSMKGDYRR